MKRNMKKKKQATRARSASYFDVTIPCRNLFNYGNIHSPLFLADIKFFKSNIARVNQSETKDFIHLHVIIYFHSK